MGLNLVAGVYRGNQTFLSKCCTVSCCVDKTMDVGANKGAGDVYPSCSRAESCLSHSGLRGAELQIPLIPLSSGCQQQPDSTVFRSWLKQ